MTGERAGAPPLLVVIGEKSDDWVATTHNPLRQEPPHAKFTPLSRKRVRSISRMTGATLTCWPTACAPIGMPFGGIVNLSYVEQDGYQTERAGHTAVTASFQWFAASALKIRSVDRETRWR